MPEFAHLHCHTQFSLLDGASDIGSMMVKAAADNMKAVALTDHGNMYGAFKFVAEANKRALKPIVGCEFYLVANRFQKSFAKIRGERDHRYHQLLLAKDSRGYQNLCKLCSFGFTEGLYSKFPRIDKTLIEKYHEGLIATSCCIGAEIPQAVVRDDLQGAEELLKWWLDRFGEDYYIEIQRHRGLEELDFYNEKGKKVRSKYTQEAVNQVLLGFAKKYNVKVISTNDAHYIDEEDSVAHDMLLCINTGSSVEDPKRFKFSSSDYYFKTQAEMNKLFEDVPFAVDNTMEIVAKVEPLNLARDVLLPAFPMSDQFKTQADCLRHLTYEGAKKRYGEITEKIRERLDFELNVINNSGYPGYFLIVQDLTSAARNMGVAVGPGRGSAAGSVVAYCTGITNVDPIKYNLLFERFLNPERVSMPDIDIDFDDEGRSKVIDYVVEKYGKNQIAQIVTYGSMAAKSSLRDVGRVMKISLSKVNEVAKTFPQNPKATLKNVLATEKKLESRLNAEDKNRASAFREMARGDGEIGKMIQSAKKLEGSIRNIGIHACGIVITPDDITNHVPISVAKDSNLFVSQFDNSVAEKAGLLKMDFLGLKTLSIIKDAVQMIEENYGIAINPDEIPLDDSKTYELFQRGETIGVFQYESPGMQKYMRELVPSKFADLVAMNALYRPGPLEHIPKFIDRKHGREQIQYELEEMQEYLEETYGITVYQEQVMLLSQKLAGFTKGQADKLRKGMGKKKKEVIDALYPLFIKGGTERGYKRKILNKIWKNWEAFASYAFNKSHSTCYAFIAFQTAYIKANYPAEFMAAVLTHNKKDISKIKFFLSECKSQGIDVLRPDVKESYLNFTVNPKGQIRFGLSALKGVGKGPVEALLKTRAEETFKDLYDFVRRLDYSVITKKCLESLALGGALDSFGLPRALYLADYSEASKKMTSLEALIKYGKGYQKQKAEMTFSLFGAAIVDKTIPLPKLKDIPEWNLIEKLKREEEITGLFLSGHPLDTYQATIKNFAVPIRDLKNCENRILCIAGIVTEAQHRVSKKGSAFGILTVKDFEDAQRILFFNEHYTKYKHLLVEGNILYLKGKVLRNKKSDESNQLDFKVIDVQLLQDVVKGITVDLQIDKLDRQMIQHLQEISEKHRGSHSLWIRLLHGEGKNQVALSLLSRKFNINANNLFIQEIEKLGLNYKLNQ